MEIIKVAAGVAVGVLVFGVVGNIALAFLSGFGLMVYLLSK
ncbi:hypothetical protein [Agarilytica rhodophyticola]|nr:hypothetical protein [Agarilytica rhodophyticola]